MAEAAKRVAFLLRNRKTCRSSATREITTVTEVLKLETTEDNVSDLEVYIDRLQKFKEKLSEWDKQIKNCGEEEDQNEMQISQTLKESLQLWEEKLSIKLEQYEAAFKEVQETQWRQKVESIREQESSIKTTSKQFSKNVQDKVKEKGAVLDSSEVSQAKQPFTKTSRVKTDSRVQGCHRTATGEEVVSEQILKAQQNSTKQNSTQGTSDKSKSFLKVTKSSKKKQVTDQEFVCNKYREPTSTQEMNRFEEGVKIVLLVNGVYMTVSPSQITVNRTEGKAKKNSSQWNVNKLVGTQRQELSDVPTAEKPSNIKSESAKLDARKFDKIDNKNISKPALSKVSKQRLAGLNQTLSDDARKEQKSVLSSQSDKLTAVTTQKSEECQIMERDIKGTPSKVTEEDHNRKVGQNMSNSSERKTLFQKNGKGDIIVGTVSRADPHQQSGTADVGENKHYSTRSGMFLARTQWNPGDILKDAHQELSATNNPQEIPNCVENQDKMKEDIQIKKSSKRNSAEKKSDQVQKSLLKEEGRIGLKEKMRKVVKLSDQQNLHRSIKTPIKGTKFKRRVGVPKKVVSKGRPQIWRTQSKTRNSGFPEFAKQQQMAKQKFPKKEYLQRNPIKFKPRVQKIKGRYKLNRPFKRLESVNKAIEQRKLTDFPQDLFCKKANKKAKAKPIKHTVLNKPKVSNNEP